MRTGRVHVVSSSSLVPNTPFSSCTHRLFSIFDTVLSGSQDRMMHTVFEVWVSLNVLRGPMKGCSMLRASMPHHLLAFALSFSGTLPLAETLLLGEILLIAGTLPTPGTFLDAETLPAPGA